MYRIEKRKIGVSEYQSLRNTTGWNFLDEQVVQKALEKDLFSVCVFDKNLLIGMGRVIGDGGIYFYIQDVVVLPSYQGMGIGKRIMDEVELYLNKATHSNSFIGLMAAEGVTEFYRKYGYLERPDNGPGMSKVIS